MIAPEIIDGWTIDGDRAWRVGTAPPGSVIERHADDVRAHNLLRRAAMLVSDLRRGPDARPTWHCSAKTLAMIARSADLPYVQSFNGTAQTLYGLPIVIDDSPELYIEIGLP